MMKHQGLVITTWGLSGDRDPMFSVDGLLLVGVVFSLVPPLWELCCSLAMPNDGNVPGNVSGEGGVLEKSFKYRFLRFSFLLSSLLSLSSFPSLPLSPPPLLFLTLSSSLSFFPFL